MHIISPKRLREFWEVHRDAEAPLRAWILAVERAAWRNFAEVRAEFPHADAVGSCVVFNIGGNKYRLIAKIVHAIGRFRGRVYVRFLLTHKEYDAENWKKDCD